MAKQKDVTIAEKILIGFKTRKEDWSVFQLTDGTLLRIKFVLINVLAKRSGKGFEGNLQSQNVLGVFAPEELRGKPSEPSTKEELAKSIVKDDVDVEKVIRQPWNEYELDNGLQFKTKSVPFHIARTSKYDSERMPIYLVESTTLVKGKWITKPKRKTRKRK